MNLLIFVFTGFLLFFLFRLLARISKIIVQKKVIRKGVFALLPLLELVLWVAYAFWGVTIFFGRHLYFDLIIGVMVVVLLLAIAWFVFRDFMAGVLLKAEKSLEPGQTIKTSFASGIIKRMGSRFMELQNEEGELVRIPYGRLSNELFILPPDDEDNMPHHLEIPLPDEASPEQSRDKVKKLIMSMPWIVGPTPEIKLSRSAEGNYTLRVVFYTHIRSQAVQVEEKLQQALSSN